MMAEVSARVAADAALQVQIANASALVPYVSVDELKTLLVPPARLPEDYLQLCTEELIKRHRIREELLVKLGVKGAA